MPSVLYFHGFAPSPGSAKIAALRPILVPYGITLDLPDGDPGLVGYAEIIREAIREAVR